MEFSLGNYTYLALLLVLPVLGGLILNYIRWRKARKNQFADRRFQDHLFPKTGFFSKLFPALYFIAFLFLIFAIIDLLAGKEQMKSQQKVSNVMFVMDVSNSMNAEDIEPNRLTEAKNIVINTLPKLGSDRVGVVVFAGDAHSIMPLTTDLSAAETYIAGIETSIVQIQGTDFLKAIEAAVKKFKGVAKGARQIVLISDGEDNEGKENAAIDLAKKEGIQISTVGVGTKEGAPVPEYFYGQLMGYKMNRNGETVISQRQENALKNMASKTDGTYIDGNSMEDAVSKLTHHLKNSTTSSTVMVDSHNAIHYYQYFLAVSLFCFLIIYLFNPKRDLNI